MNDYCLVNIKFKGLSSVIDQILLVYLMKWPVSVDTLLSVGMESSDRESSLRLYILGDKCIASPVKIIGH